MKDVSPRGEALAFPTLRKPSPSGFPHGFSLSLFLVSSSYSLLRPAVPLTEPSGEDIMPGDGIWKVVISLPEEDLPRGAEGTFAEEAANLVEAEPQGIGDEASSKITPFF